VDLSTATYSVRVEVAGDCGGATASLSPESAAQVHNDPKDRSARNLDEEGNRRRHAQWRNRALADWEKVSFQAAEPHMEQAKEIGAAHADFSREHDAHFCLGETTKDVEFSWTPMANAQGVPAAYLAQSRIFPLHWSIRE
jgi:hypothetical protein